MEKENYNSIDLMKFFASMMIICIHFGPFTTVFPLLNDLWSGVICRVAVPFFFSSSTFFLFKKLNRTTDKGDRTNIIKKFILRILILDILYSVLYYFFYDLHITFYEGINLFIFSGIAFHLWFYMALMVGVLSLYLLYTKFKIRSLLIISFLLYFLGMFGNTYYSLLKNGSIIKNIYDTYLSVFLYTRNGINFALIFIVIGFCVLKNESKLIENKKLFLRNLVLFSLSLLLLLIEAMLISAKTVNINGRDSFIMLPLTSYFFFSLIIYLNKYFKKINNKTSKFLRNQSTIIFGVHVLFIAIIPFGNSLVKYCIVLICSLLTSAIILLLSEKTKLHGLVKYLY